MSLVNKINKILSDLKNGNFDPNSIKESFGSDGDFSIPSDEAIEAASLELEKSLQPKPFPLSDSDINRLVCKYGGIELKNRILLESIKKLNPAFSDSTMKEFDESRMKNSNDLEKFLSSKGFSRDLIDVKERMSDNLDLDSLSINFPNSNRKNRDLKLGPFTFSLVIITDKGKPLFYHVASPLQNLSLDELLKKIEEKKGSAKPKECDTGSNDPDKAFDDLKKLIDRVKFASSDNQIEGLTADDIFCDPSITTDPNTGDLFYTPEQLQKFAESLCIPEPETPPATQLKEPTTKDPKKISEETQKCLDQINNILVDQQAINDKLARYQKAEKELEEILYHYRIISSFYQKLSFGLSGGVPSVNDTGQPDSKLYKLSASLNYLDSKIDDIKAKIQRDSSNIASTKSNFLLQNPNLTSYSFGIPPTTIINDLSGYLQRSIDSVKYSVIVLSSDNKPKISVFSASGIILKNYETLARIYNSDLNVVTLTTELGETIAQKEELIPIIKSNFGFDVSINKAGDFIFPSSAAQKSFRDTLASIENKTFGGSTIGFTDNEKQLFRDLFSSEEGKTFFDSLVGFSCRFKGSSVVEDPTTNILTWNFKVEYANGLGSPIPYETVKSDNPTPFIKTQTKPDIKKIQVGMEFSTGGLFEKSSPDFLTPLGFYIDFSNNTPSLSKDFYSFVTDVVNSNTPKDVIIADIQSNRGSLYSNLIELSASPWLFFTASERGDNDARKPQDLKPFPSGENGESNPIFDSFWGDYKTKWNSRYSERRAIIDNIIADIDPRIDALIPKIVSLYSRNRELLNVKFSGVFQDVDFRIENIQGLLLDIAQNVTILESQLDPDFISERINSVKCASDSGEQKKITCPPPCCGKSGQGFVNKKPVEGANSSDCPTFYTKCYWQEFSKYANRVGLLPLPNGIPPVETPAQFPSPPNIGLRYWPVGYLPPSFIPLPPPIVNPLDGTPFIRIPLPMIWTIKSPIVIPLPVGVLVIFIPFIGGFMPSPLVFYNDFYTGINVFLLGLRGFRFIPRVKDPRLKDPTRRVKEYMTRGIPKNLFPFPSLGKDDIDSPERVFGEMRSNINDMLGNKKVNVDMSEIQKIQGEEDAIYEKWDAKILDAERRKALDGNTESESLRREKELELSKFDARKRNSILNSITGYVNKIIDPPSIIYPKKSENKALLVPTPVKTAQELSKKYKLGSIEKPETVDLKSRIFYYIDGYSFEKDPNYTEQNKILSTGNKIVASFPVKISDLSTSQESVKKMNNLVSKVIFDLIGASDSPLNPKNLGLTKTSFNFPVRAPGDFVPNPGGVSSISSPELLEVKTVIGENSKIGEGEAAKIEELSINNGFSENLILREKDLRKIIKNIINSAKGKMQVDISKFPIKNGQSSEKTATSFGNAMSSIEMPNFPPRKSGIPSPATALVPGGIPPIIIPGGLIKEFITKGLSSLLEKMTLDELLPGGSSSYRNLSPQDIKSISSNTVNKTLDPGSIPPFIRKLKPPPVTARPQDMTEFTVGNSLPYHPGIEIAYSLLWKVLSAPRVPLPADVILKLKKISEVLYTIPWPWAVLLGRDVINIINPLLQREDLPRWDRMSLVNTYFVVFLDEFLRSAADISGGFKFFIGQDIIYPLPDLEIPEIISKFKSIIGVN